MCNDNSDFQSPLHVRSCSYKNGSHDLEQLHSTQEYMDPACFSLIGGEAPLLRALRVSPPFGSPGMVLNLTPSISLRSLFLSCVVSKSCRVNVSYELVTDLTLANCGSGSWSIFPRCPHLRSCTLHGVHLVSDYAGLSIQLHSLVLLKLANGVSPTVWQVIAALHYPNLECLTCAAGYHSIYPIELSTVARLISNSPKLTFLSLVGIDSKQLEADLDPFLDAVQAVHLLELRNSLSPRST